MFKDVEELHRFAPREETTFVTERDDMKPVMGKWLACNVQSAVVAAEELLGNLTIAYKRANPKQHDLTKAINNVWGIYHVYMAISPPAFTRGSYVPETLTVESAWQKVRTLVDATVDTVHEMGATHENAMQFLGQNDCWSNLETLLHYLWRIQIALTTRAPFPSHLPDIARSRARQMVGMFKSTHSASCRAHSAALLAYDPEPGRADRAAHTKLIGLLASESAPADPARPTWTPLPQERVKELVHQRLCMWHAHTKAALNYIWRSPVSKRLRNSAVSLIPPALLAGPYPTQSALPRFLNKIIADFDDGQFHDHGQIVAALKEIVALMKFCDGKHDDWSDLHRRAQEMVRLFLVKIAESPLCDQPTPLQLWPELRSGSVQPPQEPPQERPAPPQERPAPPQEPPQERPAPPQEQSPLESWSSPSASPSCPSPIRPTATKRPPVFAAPSQSAPLKKRIVVLAARGSEGGFVPYRQSRVHCQNADACSDGVTEEDGESSEVQVEVEEVETEVELAALKRENAALKLELDTERRQRVALQKDLDRERRVVDALVNTGIAAVSRSGKEDGEGGRSLR